MKPHEVTALGIGRTFQNIRLWHDMTVLDNIRLSQHYHLEYGLAGALFRTGKYYKREKEILEEALKLLEIFGLQNKADEYPKNLPYGIQRRVEIARALSVKPKLLLLDEPAAGLSSADVADLIDHIKWIHENFDITILMIEHQMQVIIEFSASIFKGSSDFGKDYCRRAPPDEIQDPRGYKGRNLRR